MPRTKKSESVPVRIRFKELKGGNKSLYLDIYHDGKRRYEFLKLFLVPETTIEARERNENTMKAANAIKAQRILDITNKKATAIHNEKARMPLLEWLDEYGKMSEAKGRRSLVSHSYAIAFFASYMIRCERPLLTLRKPVPSELRINGKQFTRHCD